VVRRLPLTHGSRKKPNQTQLHQGEYFTPLNMYVHIFTLCVYTYYIFPSRVSEPEPGLPNKSKCVFAAGGKCAGTMRSFVFKFDARAIYISERSAVCTHFTWLFKHQTMAAEI